MPFFDGQKRHFSPLLARVSQHKSLIWLLLRRPAFSAPEDEKNVGRHFQERTRTASDGDIRRHPLLRSRQFQQPSRLRTAWLRTWASTRDGTARVSQHKSPRATSMKGCQRRLGNTGQSCSSAWMAVGCSVPDQRKPLNSPGGGTPAYAPKNGRRGQVAHVNLSSPVRIAQSTQTRAHYIQYPDFVKLPTPI